MTFALKEVGACRTWPARIVRFATDGTYFGKRMLDVSIVLVALPLVLPLILFLASLLSLYGCNPFFSQVRVGRHGREFRMIKLRTMLPDADTLLRDHLATDPEARNHWEKFQKLPDDPRITPLGRILRRTSLDELPQLFNVLTGEMSLVGPRPMMPDQAPRYPGTAYYRMRPGITGPWQVSDRNAVGFADRAEFDRRYLESLSLSGDLGYLARTLAAVLRMSGH